MSGAGGSRPRAHTDTGNAERLLDRYGGDLRYCGPWKCWLVWTGKRWERDIRGLVRHWAKLTVRGIYAEAGALEDDGDRSTLVKWARKSESAAARAAMVTLATSEPSIAIAHNALDADPWLLNCENGTVDLRTGALSPHDRRQLITKLAPVAYDPDAPCPTWDAFLARVQTASELRGFLQRAAGYALTGIIRENALFFSYGRDGANGKSTYHETILAMMGDYGGPAARKLIFRSPNSDRHPTELADLFGRRFVRCSEVEEGQAFDEALVKDLTGGDTISARRMHEDFWSFFPSHKLFLAGNHKPTVRGDDGGIWRRMRLIPWAVTIPKNEQDTGLSAKLRAELPGILSWAVRGCLEWQTRGLDEPAEVREATREYRAESDALGEFLAHYVKFEESGRVPRAQLRSVYERYCGDNGAEPFGARRFSGRLRENGVSECSMKTVVSVAGLQASKIAVVNGWRGVRMLTDDERHEVGTKERPTEPVGTSDEGKTSSRYMVGTDSSLFPMKHDKAFNPKTGTDEVPTCLPDQELFDDYLKRECVGE